MQPGFQLSQQRTGFIVLPKRWNDAGRIVLIEIQAASPEHNESQFEFRQFVLRKFTIDGSGDHWTQSIRNADRDCLR